MLPSRLSFLIGTTPVTMMVRIPNSLSSLSSLSLLRFAANPSLSKTLHARSYSLPAIATAAETSIDSSSITTTAHLHPWPEWVDFIDRLKSKGYFPQTSSSLSNGGAADLVYREMNDLKDPCLSFARERYDIFGSLSKGDIQAIVEGGCPKLLRKVVNSAKRLRLYVGLDESNVCSACSLQGSCDRAYVTLQESEQDARTVDLVRLLLFYALDPLVTSGAVESQSVDQVNSSARRLLRMLTDLSDASPVPAPMQPSSKESFQKKRIIPSKKTVVPENIEMKQGDWTCPECSFMNFSRNIRCRKCSAEHPKGENAHHVETKRGYVEMKRGDVDMNRGDWNCPECNFMNFSRNVRCRQCSAEHPMCESHHVEMKRGDVQMKAGDWNCPECNFMNFSRNVRCRKCSAEHPKRESAHHVETKRGNVEMKTGDWNCPKCECMNFASRTDCFRCKESRPPRNLNPGEWECPKCDYLNFRRNINCLKCGTDRVKEAVSQYEEQFWRRPQ